VDPRPNAEDDKLGPSNSFSSGFAEYWRRSLAAVGFRFITAKWSGVCPLGVTQDGSAW